MCEEIFVWVWFFLFKLPLVRQGLIAREQSILGSGIGGRDWGMGWSGNIYFQEIVKKCKKALFALISFPANFV